MSVAIFRHLYGYHFAENRALWDNHILQLSHAAFSQPSRYAHGSIQKQILHLIEVEEVWFCGLRGVDFPDPLEPAHYSDYTTLRAYWDAVEAHTTTYLDTITEAKLHSQPLEGEDKELRVWQVLLQVVNHATDHRAQILRALHDMGHKTTSQDYIFYAYKHPAS
ncbi:MAG: hypothetical protein RLZZ297_558 [Chloroflexota bacterium]|jgi:uncharacterized damage-inducible protein DinB